MLRPDLSHTIALRKVWPVASRVSILSLLWEEPAGNVLRYSCPPSGQHVGAAVTLTSGQGHVSKVYTVGLLMKMDGLRYYENCACPLVCLVLGCCANMMAGGTAVTLQP